MVAAGVAVVVGVVAAAVVAAAAVAASLHPTLLPWEAAVAGKFRLRPACLVLRHR